ncbi:MAG: hypothetical protein VCC00_09170 [Deltaproteobacteria bacterium]
MKKFSGTLSVEQACREILAGLDAGRTTIVPGRRARLARWLSQKLPKLMDAVADQMVRRELRRS